MVRGIKNPQNSVFVVYERPLTKYLGQYLGSPLGLSNLHVFCVFTLFFNLTNFLEMKTFGPE